jgi:hypothetical protein
MTCDCGKVGCSLAPGEFVRVKLWIARDGVSYPMSLEQLRDVNPAVCDVLLTRMLEQRTGRLGSPS